MHYTRKHNACVEMYGELKMWCLTAALYNSTVMDSTKKHCVEGSKFLIKHNKSNNLQCMQPMHS